MSYQVDHRLAKKGFAVPFHVDGSIVYSDAGSTNFRNKAVTITGNATVGLATDGDAVIGTIITVEPPDPISTKAGVITTGYLQFENSAGAPAVTPGAAVVGGATAGDVRDVNPAVPAEVTAGLGVVTQVIGTTVIVRV